MTFLIARSTHSKNLFDILPNNYTVFFEKSIQNGLRSVNYHRCSLRDRTSSMQSEDLYTSNFYSYGLVDQTYEGRFVRTEHVHRHHSEYTHLVYAISLDSVGLYNILPGTSPSGEIILYWRFPIIPESGLSEKTTCKEAENYAKENIDKAVRISEKRSLKQDVKYMLKSLREYDKNNEDFLALELIRKILGEVYINRYAGVDEIGKSFLAPKQRSAFISLSTNQFLMIGFYDKTHSDYIMYEGGSVKASNPDNNFLKDSDQFYVVFYAGHLLSKNVTQLFEILVRPDVDIVGGVRTPIPIKYNSAPNARYCINTVSMEEPWKDHVLNRDAKFLSYISTKTQKPVYGFYYGLITPKPLRLKSVVVGDSVDSRYRIPMTSPDFTQVVNHYDRGAQVVNHMHGTFKYWIKLKRGTDDVTYPVTLTIGNPITEGDDDPTIKYSSTLDAIRYQMRGLTITPPTDSIGYGLFNGTATTFYPDYAFFHSDTMVRELQTLYLCDQFQLISDTTFTSLFKVNEDRMICDNVNLEGANALIETYARLKGNFMALNDFLKLEWIYTSVNPSAPFSGGAKIIIGDFYSNRFVNPYRELPRNVDYYRIFLDFDMLEEFFEKNPSHRVIWQNNLIWKHPTENKKLIMKKQFCATTQVSIHIPDPSRLVRVLPTTNEYVKVYLYKR